MCDSCPFIITDFIGSVWELLPWVKGWGPWQLHVLLDAFN